MRMFNADGSESEMCGNGIRCVAKFVHDHGIASKPRLTIETGRGVLTLDLEVQDGRVTRVRVNMGEPILEAAKIPTTLAGNPPCNTPLLAGGREFAVTCVSMGNPHAVMYVGDEFFDSRDRDWVAEFGPKIEHHEAFPRRVNAHFVKVHSPTEVTIRTWERGSGLTLACGTGACAVCVAGVLTGRTARKIRAHLPGGDLELEWSEADNCVYKTGPAVEVFTGEWPAA
jgi:diaminopimelate epimerase